MKYFKEKRCPKCNVWYVYDRTHYNICPDCSKKLNSYLNQIKFQQKQLARMIFEMVKNLTDHDIIRLRNHDFEYNHHCQHCNRVLPPDIYPVLIIPNETQNTHDPNFGIHRRKNH